MRKLNLLMHVSLDGFVTDQQGGMGWIKIDETIFAFIDNKVSSEVSTALYGRNTYELMESYWPTAADAPDASEHSRRHSAWYMNVDKIVLSTRLRTSNEKATVIADNVAERINDEKNKKGKDILIFGSPSATHSLLSHDLIDELWLFINPVLIGNGTKLFDQIPAIEKLRLLETQQFESGVLFVKYERERNG